MKKNPFSRSIVALSITIMLSVLVAGCGAASPMSGGASSSRADDGFYYDAAMEEMAEMPAAEPMAPGEYEGDFAANAVGGAGADGVAQTASDTAIINAQTEGAQTQRLIIRTGYISLAVEDTRGSRVAIEGLVNQYAGGGAFVVSSQESGGGEQPYITMQIRVPSENFDAVMDDIAEMGVEVYDRNESGQDVTEEFVDLQARLESLEAARDRLLDIIRDAQTTEDLLLAEQQLTQREAEIESIKGRMQYLSTSARLSSITVNLQPYILSQPIDTRWRPAETFRRAIDNLLDSLRGFADFLILFSISVLPWLVGFGLVIYAGVRFVINRVNKARDKRSQRKAAQAAQQAYPEDEA